MNESLIIIIGIITIFILFININNILYVENFKPNDDINNTLFDTYLNYNKKVYEYILGKNIPVRNKQPNTDNTSLSVTKIYNNINLDVKELFDTSKCGFTYNYYESKSALPGSMYLTDSGLAITYEDLNKNNRLFSVIESSITIVISDGIITHQIKKEEVNIDPVSGIITVFVDAKIYNNTYFKTNIKYTLYPCSVLEHISNPPSNFVSPPTNNFVYQYLVDNNIYQTFWIFLGLFALIFVVYNWKYLYGLIQSKLSKQKKKDVVSEDDSDLDINNIYYVGGYDYRDYSE